MDDIYDVIFIFSRYRLCADYPGIINYLTKKGMKVGVIPFPDPVDVQYGMEGFNYLLKLLLCQGAKLAPLQAHITCKSLFVSSREVDFLQKSLNEIVKYIKYEKSFYMQPILSPEPKPELIEWLKNYTYLVRNLAIYQFLYSEYPKSNYEEVGIPAIDNPVFSLNIKYLLGLPSLTTVEKSWRSSTGQIIVNNINSFLDKIDDVVVIKDINCLRMIKKLEYFDPKIYISKENRNKVIMLDEVIGLAALLGIENFLTASENVISGYSTTLWYAMYTSKPIMNLQTSSYRFSDNKIFEIYFSIPTYNGNLQFHQKELQDQKHKPGACQRIAELVS